MRNQTIESISTLCSLAACTVVCLQSQRHSHDSQLLVPMLEEDLAPNWKNATQFPRAEALCTVMEGGGQSYGAGAGPFLFGLGK